MGLLKRSSRDGNRRIIVGLDLGTTKTSAIIAEQVDAELNLIGLGTSPAVGLKHGVVVNIEHTVRSILEAVEAAEHMADVRIESTLVGIAGDHVRSINSRGMIAIGRTGRNGQADKITRDDIERVITTARAVTLPSDRQILHVIPQDFLVDDREGFKDPSGIIGMRLEANVNIITAALTAAQTIFSCLHEADIHAEELVLQPLASSLAVLTDDERDLGVALVDLGGGTADLAVFYDGAIRHAAVIGLGGENVTRDLAHGLRLPRNEAERIKLQFGCAHADRLNHEEPIPLSNNGDRPERCVTQDVLVAIIKPRMEEIFDLVQRELRAAECLPKLTSGIVLTGGASLIPGAIEVAEEVFDLPVRLGRPIGVGCLKELADSPAFATSVGLILYGAQQQNSAIRGLGGVKKRRTYGPAYHGKIQNIKRKIAEIF